uniref:Type II secretion system protein GspF domain-containing protein n=1 Tax=Candidatus Methanomethylicus mesodigestus TaxID=1867258 RepID=A0A7C3J3K6_9CREN
MKALKIKKGAKESKVDKPAKAPAPEPEKKVEMPKPEPKPEKKGKGKDKTKEKGKGKKGMQLPDLSLFAYNIFGKYIGRMKPLIKDMDNDLRRALMRTTAERYMSKALLVTILSFVISAAVTIPIFLRWYPLFSALETALGLTALITAVTFTVMYMYPAYAAKRRRSAIDSAINFAAQYMAILAGAEVTPERIFKSILKADVDMVVKDEVAEVVKGIDIFGEDFYTALGKRIKETPSRKFSDLMKGILAVGSMGGDLRRYLHMQGKIFMRDRRTNLKKQLDGLGVTAEIYISMGVVLPLIIVVMLATMSFINSGGIDSLLWMYVVTFVMIPAVSALMLLIIDTSVPREE